MYQTPVEIYKKNRTVGLEFIKNEIFAERIESETDKEYLKALRVVENRIESEIAREEEK